MWLREHRLVKLHKRLGHALALPSLAAVLTLSVTVMDYPKENLLQITPLKGRDL